MRAVESKAIQIAIVVACALTQQATFAGDAVVDVEEDGRETNNRYTYEISGGLSYSDNVGQTATDKVWEVGLETGIKGEIDYQHRRVKTKLGSDLQFRTHGKLGFNDELLGGLAGSLDYNLVNERLRWVVEENFGQSLINSQNQGTPDNKQNVNYFSTGPELSFPFGPRTQIVASGRWSDVAYMKSDEDTRHLEGTVGIQRQLGLHTQISVNGKTEHISFKSFPSSLDYDVNSAYLGWAAVGAKTTLSLNAGYTQLKEQANTTAGALYGLQLKRTLSSRSEFQFNAGREFDDGADVLRRLQAIRGPAVGSQDVNVSSDPFRSDYGTAAWIFRGGRSTIQFSGDWRRETHVRVAALDMESRGGGLSITREITPRMTLAFNTDVEQQQFRTTGVKFDEWTAGVQLGWNITNAFALTGSISHQVGSGDTALGQGTRDFTVNYAVVRLHWSPRRPRDDQLPN
jgi:hypothetical protein